jgi:hypothetical protein
MTKEEVARIIHISALSQLTVELIEESIYEDSYKRIVKKKGEEFVKLLDKKLNYMLDEKESAKQLLNYTTMVQDELKEWSDSIEEKLTELL